MADARPEPSMEDILASIKRIISDDQTAPPQPAAPPSIRQGPPSPAPRSVGAPLPGWPRPPSPPESVLELTDRIPGRVPDRTAEAAPPPRPAPAPEPPVAPVQRAVDRLRQAEAEMAQPAPRPVPRDLMPRTPTPRPTGGDMTLDALVRDALQPLLSDWIERNLPDMVERLVQAEIRRMMDKEG